MTGHNRLALLAIFLLIATLGWVLLYWSPAVQTTLNLRERPRGGDFVLDSHAGPVSLQQFRGKVVALYFGYTQCPDVCPTSLGFLSLAVNELSAEELAGFQGLFVSVDPERDSLAHLQSYGAYFHPSILGITGDKARLDPIVESYGAAYRKVESASAMGYLIDHSSETYLIDRNGVLAEVLAHGTPPVDLLAALRRLLAQPQ
ncbi:MAG: SCO family protein [Gammaproteobacteria bacterium]|nr:SCO family protein [Gammaproteobacteria bacterium]